MVLLSDVWRDETPSFQKNERMERCIADVCLREKSVACASVIPRVSTVFRHVHVFFCFGLFCFLVSCNLEVLNCGVIAFDLS